MTATNADEYSSSEAAKSTPHDAPPPPMPLLSISSPATIQKCASLQLRSTDIFIVSYPKSGTTWLQHIVLSLLLSHLSTSSSPVTDYSHVSDYAPFFEIDAHWKEDQLVPWIRENHAHIGRRLFNTHLRFDMLPKGRNAKFIYIVRSPLDTCVSFFHHLSNQVEGGFRGDFSEFFRDWMNGDIAFGSWPDHVLSFVTAFSNGDDSHITLAEDGREFLLLTYEEMIENLPKVVARLVEFLDLKVSAQQQRFLLPTFSFAHMKANMNCFQPKSVQWKNNFSFLRKGQAGDGNSIVTNEQRGDFDSWMEKTQLEWFLSNVLRKTNPVVHKTIQTLLIQRQHFT